MARIKRNPVEYRANDGGFTLLEVLVAFVIAAPALALLFGQGVQSVGVARTTARYQEAIGRAQSRLVALPDRDLVSGEQNGDDGDGFRWHMRVVPLAFTPAPRPAPRASPYAAGTTLYAVTVEVSWPGHVGARAVTLSTRRLGPGGPSRP